MFLILWITVSESAAQKPAIDLLPSYHGYPHPEAVIDTSARIDTLAIRVKSGFRESDPDLFPQEKAAEPDRPFLLRNTSRNAQHGKRSVHLLIFRTLHPARPGFRITALNI
jgi:hypothetical protein